MFDFLVNFAPKGLTIWLMAKEKNTQVENRILDAARAVFLKNGFDGARMQEIADKAGVNKALLHYYFRDKESMYREVFDTAMQNFRSRLLIFNDSSKSIQQKITEWCEACQYMLENHPDIVLFLFAEISRCRDIIPDYVLPQFDLNQSHLAKQMNDGIQIGLISHENPDELVMMLLSLSLFPVLWNNVYQSITPMNTYQYKQLTDIHFKNLPNIIMSIIKS